MLSTQRVVCLLMQLYAIGTFRLETFTRYGIETRCMLLHSLIEQRSLHRRRIQLYDNRSVHAKTISYIQKSVNIGEVNPPYPPKERKGSFIPVSKGQGYPEPEV
jgi:hypothetical protein